MPQAAQCACWLLSQSLVAPRWASADAQCAMLAASAWLVDAWCAASALASCSWVAWALLCESCLDSLAAKGSSKFACMA